MSFSHTLITLRLIVSRLLTVVLLVSPLYEPGVLQPPDRPADNQCEWQGSASNSWDDPQAWSNCPNGTPTADDDVIIGSGMAIGQARSSDDAVARVARRNERFGGQQWSRHHTSKTKGLSTKHRRSCRMW